MTGAIISISLLWMVALTLAGYWWQSVRDHGKRLDQLDVRIHVNGIRGKSTVTRLVASVMREGGFVTVAKTTGSAARVIGPLGEETPIRRTGAPTINEQIAVVREHVVPGVEGLVMECMAVRPLYQEYSQDHMVKSDITVITNVREDHQEEMGETLEEIADSLALTVPRTGVLITAEERPELRDRLAQRAAERSSRFIYADPAGVTDDDMRGFDYLQFKENVAIGLSIAELLGISREAAIRGMWKGVPDVGVVRLRTVRIRDKSVTWVPMFAANDRESVVLTLQSLVAQFPSDATVIGILNNRLDRGRRAELFAQMASEDLEPFLDHTVLFGAFEDTVEHIILAHGMPPERLHRMGDSLRLSLEEILDGIAALIPGEHGVLIGMVNIHTHQAELLLEHMAHEIGAEHVDELLESLNPARQPDARRRLRYAAARRTPAVADSS
ncbi:poly-gamma-glutamate synthase PgsB [Nocardioides sp.]|uniref:poly-gamma-glutamate synthase PgsB n=1 Tax=Nocardioides sp. TaxID=35761 RepID=UPI003D0CC1BC